MRVKKKYLNLIQWTKQENVTSIIRN